MVFRRRPGALGRGLLIDSFNGPIYSFNGPIYSFNEPIYSFNGLIYSFNGLIYSFNGLIYSFNERIYSFNGRIASVNGHVAAEPRPNQENDSGSAWVFFAPKGLRNIAQGCGRSPLPWERQAGKTTPTGLRHCFHDIFLRNLVGVVSVSLPFPG
uniref:Uncharacterized protein n=1 Tax=Candidatus Kentrum sp. DK TaxID=2126562 RepID=A0A450SWK9_9GAMM|nr:MAG: hypothetical protein BECKDK2373B_GA0170837_107223 [Candidatus Kentron sp. DK]